MAILERNDIGAVTRLTMNAPERLNALSDEMLAALTNTLTELRETTTCRAIIIEGAGKAFCAGHDLKQMEAKRAESDGGRAAWEDLFDRCATFMQMIPAQPQPVIAQVHGIATAAGCQLVASCDLAVAAESTRFGVNGVNIGLFCSTPMVALSRNISRKQAFELLTTGDFIDAERARELGLINRVSDPDSLADDTLALAEQIAGKLGTAVKIGKQAFYKQIEMPLAQAYDYTGAVMVENMADRDTAEGVAAFIEKRAPNWDQD
ncbi:enoyl-CoA hydratase [Shimia ponticola]|uniref:enoyl-CoA hydratase n=1 Tax=Shimia ponticola TaxID=2582893 RepID=UPI0011BE6616|nr:enoyl-CoA hydratase [Shimia ponticola]